MNNKHFIDSLTSEREKIAEQVKAKFYADLLERKKNGLTTIPLARGVFGPESKWADGYVEEIIKPENGGTFMKLYGCNYLHKGDSPTDKVQGIQLAKALFSEVPRNIVAYLPLTLPFFLLSWLLLRRLTLKFMATLATMIEDRVTKPYGIPAKEINVFPNELYRALVLAAQGEGIWTPIIEKTAGFIRLFMELDNTYRYRVQDALFRAKSTTHMFHIMQKRETGQGIGYKWAFLRFVVWFLIHTSPALYRIEKRFMKALDRSAVEMDEADLYFALTFKSYDFDGWPLKDRLLMRKQADDEMQNVFLI